MNLINYWIYTADNLNPGTLAIVGMVFLGISLILVGVIFAIAAQVKVKGFYWWHHSVMGWCCKWIWKGICWCANGLCKLADILPIIWKHLLLALAMLTVPILFMILAMVEHSLRFWWIGLFVISVLADVVVVLYIAYAYGTLLRGARQMAEGELVCKIDTKYLIGIYARTAEHLNTLADVAVEAAKNQMRSERMKTELITNISHDIKTPLTSIINYVDILERAQSREEAVQYLEVLGRQSKRLKKLIEDLMEMSKATSGNMAVEIFRVDPVEAMNQALGEFSDKLDAAQLQVVFRQPETPLAMLADGRLTWRVLSNLLSNIVKYAMPGTRVYADVVCVDGQVLVSLKNISREPLNVEARELTERFVRGDASRNTEGSGLGLNIAKSLMELQKGQLQLLVDGDLFKVTLIFPAAR
jgi:signal transduction histidine kinase